MRRVAALTLLALPAAAFAAGAQTQDAGAGSGASSQLVMLPMTSETPAYTAPQIEHLMGDLGGVRADLENRGIYLRLSATAEFAGNVSGGVQQGSTSANQVAFSADIDWQRLAGVTGAFHPSHPGEPGVLGRWHDSHLFGDNVSPVQVEIFGAGGNVAVHPRFCASPNRRCWIAGSTASRRLAG